MVKRLLILTIIFLSCSAMTLIYFTKNDSNKQEEKPALIEQVKPIFKPYPKNFFAWPIKGNIDLAGNFGELRTNHFHSGIDIRTGEGKTGIPVYAAGDGYIGRINISAKGYGKALYIVHPNGYTTVYGHLMGFNSAIAGYIEKEHYSKKAFEIEAQPEADFLKVKKGDLIAYSGNTGGSAGPHLHFEIRDSETGNALNPLLCGLILEDNTKPKINSITVYGLDNTNRLETGTYRFSQFSRVGNSIANSQVNLKPGVYAFGASWIDYLRPGGFRMGIPYAKLYINGKLVFEQKIEQIPFADWRLMNCHLDHPVLEEKDLKIVKLFVDDGNSLKFYPNLVKQGKLIVEENKQYQVKLVISDFPGHKDSLKFTVNGMGETASIPERIFVKETPLEYQKKLFYPNDVNQIEVTAAEATLKIEIPKGVLYDTVLFRTGPTAKRINANTVWDIMSSAIPVNDSFSVAFKPSDPISNLEKYVIIRLTRAGGKKPEKTVWQGGYLSAKAKMLGQFYYDVDETSPVISGVKINGRRFSGKVTDAMSGIKEITTTVNDRWILTDYEPKSDFISGKIPDFIAPGKYVFKITVTDNCGNTKEFSQTIIL
jgi:hypothetical protein